MGMIELIKITAATIKTLRASPGDSVVIKGKGLGSSPREATLYQQHGFRSRPVDGSRGIFIPLGSGTREGIVIATENYTIDITLDEGGAAIYSTNAAGAVQAKIILRADGSMELNGSTKKLITDALETSLSNYSTLIGVELGKIAAGIAAGGGAYTPINPSFDITAAKTTTVKTGG